jgi:uncharacterized protein YjhX (UPF0386 family)
MFSGFKEGETFVKMKKPSKKKSVASCWEGPYLIIRYLDGHGFLEQDEGGKICVVKGKNEKMWDRLQCDLQLFHSALALLGLWHSI